MYEGPQELYLSNQPWLTLSSWILPKKNFIVVLCKCQDAVYTAV